MKTFIGLLLLCQATAYALPARYSVTGKCYGVTNPGTKNEALQFIDSAYGLSGLHCQNAYNNLVKVCGEYAANAGFADSRIYKDIELIQQTDTVTRTHEAILSLKQKERLRRNVIRTSQIKNYRYLPVIPTEQADCQLDAQYPQEQVPTLQGRNWGG